MLQETKKLHILSDILESPEFRESKRYRDLLQYLVKETLSGSVPKEITIGTDFFHKDPSFDPKEDPTVRVYLNNLRKKLEHYYLTSDSQHGYRLEIPRGRYQVEFIRTTRKSQRIASKSVVLAVLVLSSLAILLILWFILFGPSQGARQQVLKPNSIWAEFVSSGGRPTIVVLGDFFFLFERTDDGKTRNFVRNLNINSLDDFKAMVKQDPSFAARYVQSDFTFLRPSASWGLAQILPVLQSSPNGISLKLASQFSVDDLKASNIVFVGSFKTLYSLHKFLHIFGLEYSLSPNRLEVRGDLADSIKIFSPKEIKGGSYEKDFAVIAKGAGPEGSTILLLLGFSDSGVIEAARAVTDQQMVSSITHELAKGDPKPFHFTIVLETEGINQAIFKSQLRYFTQHQSQLEATFRKNADTSHLK